MNTSVTSSTARGFPLSEGQQAVLLGWRRISRSRRLLLVLPWIGFALQALLSSSSQDLICSGLASAGAFLVLFDAFRPERFYFTPLSTLVVLGFAVTLQLGPLLFTALEGHTLSFNLLAPIDTFGHGLLSSLVSLLAHALYRQAKLLRLARLSLQQLLVRLKLFQPLRTTEVVVMGGLGVLALASSTWLAGLADTSSVLVKFLQGFQFLSIIPASFVLQRLCSQQARSDMPNTRIPLVLWLLFMGLIMLVSLGRNARSPVVVPLACLFLGVALEWFYGLIRIRLAAVLAFCLAVVFVLPIGTDLATAMVMVRGQRGDVPAEELLYQTIDLFKDRESIASYRRASLEYGLLSDWSEVYVTNVFLSRFANAKFPDNSLVNASLLEARARDEMATFQWLRLISTFPGPVLSVLGVPEDIKEEVTSYSFGDKLYSLATGSNNALGGFRTGHFFGTGMAGFGYGYLLILLIGLLLVFPLVDALALEAAHGFTAAPLISFVAITQIFTWFTFSNAESVAAVVAFPLRGFLEPVVLFALVRWLLARLRFA